MLFSVLNDFSKRAVILKDPSFLCLWGWHTVLLQYVGAAFTFAAKGNLILLDLLRGSIPHRFAGCILTAVELFLVLYWNLLIPLVDTLMSLLGPFCSLKRYTCECMFKESEFRRNSFSNLCRWSFICVPHYDTAVLRTIWGHVCHVSRCLTTQGCP